MPVKDFGKKLNNTLRGAVDTVKAKAEETELPDIKKLGEKASEQVKSIFQKKNGDEAPNAAASSAPTAISARSALKVIYYFMAADGEIFHGEEEKFDAIGRELLSDFDASKELLVAECRNAMENVIDPEDHYDVIRDCVENAVLVSPPPDGAFIAPKLLVWDLLTVAYSDESYNETERRLLKYIVRKLNIDKAVFLEMESSILTMMDIETALSWIKTTDRPYLKIETMVNELTKRESVIVGSIHDLITL